MKVKIEMIVEVNDGVEDFEINSSIVDALGEFTGNNVEFYDVKIENTQLGLTKFTHDTDKVIVLESFEATITNPTDKGVVKYEKNFIKNDILQAESWRPEGMRIDGFFVFNKHARNFAKTY